MNTKFRNALSSNLFLAICVTATVFSSFSALGLFVSLFRQAALGEDFSPVSLSVAVPILAIIGTIGLYMAHFASKRGDGMGVVSGLKMAKCWTALLIVVNVIGYIAAVACMGVGILFGITGDMIYDDIGFGISSIFDSGLAIGLIVFILEIAGIIMLAVFVCLTIYRKGISKVINAAIDSETNVTDGSFKPSGFATVFGYIIGVIIALNAFSFTANLLTFGTSCLANLSLGTMIFLLSLLMSKLRGNSDVTAAPQPHCTVCGSVIPTGAAFCMTCGKSVYSSSPAIDPVAAVPVPQPDDRPVDTVDTEESSPNETPNGTEPSNQPEATEKKVPKFCPSCGKPVAVPTPKFCSNCGFRLK